MEYFYWRLRRPGDPEVVAWTPSDPNMSLFTLNLDVLDAILSYTDIYDTFMLSLTCRDGQRIATPRFLDTITFPLPWLWLHGAKRTLEASWELYDSFTAYMLAPGTHRLEFLKDLTLGEDAFCIEFGDRMEFTVQPRYDFRLAISLADVVRGAAGLRRLSIDRAESVFETASQLVEAIASLKRLEEVCFRDADVITLGLLSTMQSRPRKVEIYIKEYNDLETRERWWGRYTVGEDSFLHNFTECLETLHLGGGFGIIQMLEPSTVWPAVRELKLPRSQGWPRELVDLQVMSHAFPNLRYLHVDELPESATLDLGGRWKTLDTIHSGDPIPLHCLVRYLNMGDRWVNRDRMLDTTAPILRKTLPIIVECPASKAHYRCFAEHAPSIRFLRVHHAPGSDPSDRLSSDFSDSWSGRTDRSALAILADEFSCLRTLPLKAIEVNFRTKHPWYHEGMMFHEEASKTEFSKTSISKTFPWEQYAGVIATCIPALEYIGIRQELSNGYVKASWSKSPWGAEYEPRPYEWYKVKERRAQEAILERLSDGRANFVHSTLLRLSRDDI